jgi:hypothetical protein
MARDWLTQAFGSAIADIRSKLIDEGWFGRAGSEQRTPDSASDRDRLIDFGHFGSGDVSPIGRNPDAQNHRWIDPPKPKEVEAPAERDHGIDR